MIQGTADLPVGAAFKRHPAEPNGPVYVKLERLMMPAALEEGEKTARCNAVCVWGPEEEKGKGIFVAGYTGVAPFRGELIFGR